MTRHRTRGFSAVAGVDLVIGVGLLVAGRRLWRQTTGQRPTPVESAAVTALGLRYVAQTAALALAPRRTASLVGWVDVIHAGTMVPLVGSRTAARLPARISLVAALAEATILARLRHPFVLETGWEQSR